MPPEPSMPSAPRPSMPESSREEVSILEYIRAIWKRRRLVAGTFAAAVLGTLLYCLLSPKIYESRATVVSPTEGGLTGFRASLLAAGVPGLAALPLGPTRPNRNLFVSILRSDTMARDVVERFKLKDRYGVDYMSEAVDALRARTRISLTETDTISIRVEETDPQLAADIANHYIANLDRMLTRFETTEAGKQRAFVERRLAETAGQLNTAEESLKRFQEDHKAFALQEQARGLVEEVARLKGQIIAEEVLLAGLRTTASDRNPEVIRARTRIEAMKKQLEKQFGEALSLGPRPPGAPADEPIDLLPFKDFPELGLELARLTRDVKIYETVYSLLTQQLEEAKIAEARDTPKVQVIDHAVPAELKSRPRTRLSLMVAAGVSLIAGVLLCFVLEHVEAMRHAAAAAAPPPPAAPANESRRRPTRSRRPKRRPPAPEAGDGDSEGEKGDAPPARPRRRGAGKAASSGQRKQAEISTN